MIFRLGLLTLLVIAATSFAHLSVKTRPDCLSRVNAAVVGYTKNKPGFFGRLSSRFADRRGDPIFEYHVDGKTFRTTPSGCGGSDFSVGSETVVYLDRKTPHVCYYTDDPFPPAFALVAIGMLGLIMFIVDRVYRIWTDRLT